MAIDELQAAFGLRPVMDAVAASDAVRMGMDPNNMFMGSGRNVNAYLQAQQAQEAARKAEEEKQRLLQERALAQASEEAIRRQQLLTSLMDLSGRQPSVDLGGGPRGDAQIAQGQRSFTNQDLPRFQHSNPAPQDALDRLFQMGPQMHKELFDALIQGSLKDQLTPAATPQGLGAVGFSPEQVGAMGRVPQKSVQDLLFGKAKGEDRINAMMEGYKLRAQEGAANRTSRENIAGQRLGQQSEQFKQRMDLQRQSLELQEQRALAAGTSKIPAKIANTVLEEAAANGMDEAQQAVLAASMGYSLAGTIPQSSMFGDKAPKGVVGQAKPKAGTKPLFNPTLPEGFKATFKPGKTVKPKPDLSTPRG